ncbi:hypothetical protein EZ313_00235 [Ramlibacter henchirensis]|uniref:Cell envelope biogenesis protein TolA n=1 Tax=Ramlibacter henchirensis TaxID=204072 RepID=A0A4Z0C0L3_9BURK|nr:hypothetical protein [Ramlibacter henchirensis]TFZ05147.1 hypothetical protein EZ313_00235 [Ramlibacter henchirensis]
MKASILCAAIAIAFAAALPAQAQGTNPTGPDNKSTQKAGEAYPNDKTAGTDKGKPEAVKKAENSRPAQATKRVAKKTGNAVSNTAKRAADATRNAGDNIAKKLPGNKEAAPQR